MNAKLLRHIGTRGHNKEKGKERGGAVGATGRGMKVRWRDGG